MPSASLMPADILANHARSHASCRARAGSVRRSGTGFCWCALADDLLPGLLLLLSSRFSALPVLLGGPLPQRLLLRQIRAFQQGHACCLYADSASEPLPCSSLRSMHQQWGEQSNRRGPWSRQNPQAHWLKGCVMKELGVKGAPLDCLDIVFRAQTPGMLCPVALQAARAH